MIGEEVVSQFEINNGEYIFTDSFSEKTTVFSEKEYFIIDSISRPYTEVVLVARYCSKFNVNYTLEELRCFISRLQKLGLFYNIDSLDKKKNIEKIIEPVALSPKKNKYKNHFFLFYPEDFLDVIIKWFGFLKVFKIIFIIVFFVSLIGLFYNINSFIVDFLEVKGSVSFLGHLLFSLFTISLITQLFRGVVARNFKLSTPSFGLTLVFGVLPRFNIKIDIPYESSRKVKLWVISAPICIRFVLFSFGFFLWLIFRSQGTSISSVGIGISVLSAISFFFIINPFLNGAGYQFISEYYNIGNLRKKSFSSLKYFFIKPPAAVAKFVNASIGLRVYALVSILFICFMVSVVGYSLATWLKLNYRGLGVFVFILVFFYIIFRFRNRLVFFKSKGILNRFENIYKYIGYILFSIFLFLPYSYEAGGHAEVFPVSYQEIYMVHSGVLKTVNFNGGELLSKGELIAVIDDSVQKKDVVITKSNIAHKNAELQQLLTTPSIDEIQLAEQELSKAKLQYKYSVLTFNSIKKLYRNKHISTDGYRESKKEVDLNESSIKEKEINLKLVTNKINKFSIEALKIELKILNDELSFYINSLNDTKVIMPFNGRIVTMDLKNKKNKYFYKGDLFAVVEDTSKIKVKINIPESDIGEVEVGALVEFKLTSYPDQKFSSSVSEIYPMMVEDTYGSFVPVICIVDNSDSLLKSGMTGYAKITGEKKFVVQAFTRAVRLFLRIEAWSWLP